ncbi:Uncharacterised protein [Mycobacteroides abscessus subsp. abscessus]|nr:hypothetical protein [Mycobacteroides abscessus]SIK24920.1 Uncharacterised protein [Mycobacteroides abscessus subsp. abscessus]SLC57476.1 Uncharacterised protein [Mycobacteroides abscessus subsp. massiliense]OTR18119.1 hypothetical protein B9M82_02870 [Mycobacteroides abscessus]SIL67973.1 Uncharacterised protein [Mycobacteroides abscessus subsp. abscessus]
MSEQKGTMKPMNMNPLESESVVLDFSNLDGLDGLIVGPIGIGKTVSTSRLAVARSAPPAPAQRKDRNHD